MKEVEPLAINMVDQQLASLRLQLRHCCDDMLALSNYPVLKEELQTCVFNILSGYAKDTKQRIAEIIQMQTAHPFMPTHIQEIVQESEREIINMALPSSTFTSFLAGRASHEEVHKLKLSKSKAIAKEYLAHTAQQLEVSIPSASYFYLINTVADSSRSEFHSSLTQQMMGDKQRLKKIFHSSNERDKDREQWRAKKEAYGSALRTLVRTRIRPRTRIWEEDAKGRLSRWRRGGGEEDPKFTKAPLITS